MNKKYQNINYDKLWSPSGDPFVDAGGYALKYLSEKFPGKDILELIDFATEIYVDKWNSAIKRVFFNSKITNPTVKGDKRKETHLYFENLLKCQSASTKGYCRILGFETELYQADRTNFPISGAQSLINFFHYFESGLMLSKEAIIRVFFLPIACEVVGVNLAIVNSNNLEVSHNFVTSCCKRIFKDIGENSSKKMLESKYHSLGTALFGFIDSILSENDYDNIRLTLYLYNNGKELNFEFYDIPETVFQFYRETQKSSFRSDWNDFVSHYYIYYKQKCEYINKDDTVKIKIAPKRVIIVSQDNYNYWNDTIINQHVNDSEKKTCRNIIYDRLLFGLDLTKIIRKWSEDKYFNLDLFKCYLINIKKMKIETINKINEIANFILTNTPESDIKKTITNLNGITSASLLRRIILKLVEKNYALGNESTLVTVKEYTDYLFPETGSWMEIRDVLLINIYQKLHEKQIKVEIDDIEDDFIDDNN